jgi:plastocyanin
MILLLLAAQSVSGRAILEGESPKISYVRMTDDCRCKEKVRSECSRTESVDGENRIPWVIVWVSSKVEGEFPIPQEPAIVDQRGCMYVPHALAVRRGQQVKIRNSDPTEHNVHGFPQVNREFNYMQKPGAENGHQFQLEPEPFRIKCDIHPWMHVRVAVFEHPYFAVTGLDGAFEIRELPPGEHELTLWHETFGRQKVRVKPGEESIAVKFQRP